MYRKTEIEKEVTGGLKLVKTPDPDGSISCHYTHLPKGCDMEDISKSQIETVDFHLLYRGGGGTSTFTVYK